MTPGKRMEMKPIALRCRECGNAVLRDRLPHEAGMAEVSDSSCNLCDRGESSELFYTTRDGKVMTWTSLMDTLEYRP